MDDRPSGSFPVYYGFRIFDATVVGTLSQWVRAGVRRAR